MDSERVFPAKPRPLEAQMNRRTDERIEMRLPCQVLFPAVWHASVSGMTANLHRNGVLVACDVRPGERPPAVGERASIRIQLPAHHRFTRKCIECETTLVRVSQSDDSRWYFAMRIQNMLFRDVTSHVMDMEGDFRYVN